MAMTIRFTDDETEALREAAAREGVSMQDFARRAVRDAISTWQQDRDRFLAQFAEQNKSLLDRLGQ